MSSTINQMLDIALPSSLTAVHKDSSFRLYATATDGGIHEARYDGSWTGGSSNDVIATGKLGSPVAAAAIGLDTIRVYYLSSNSILQEAGSDDGRRWCDGDLGKADFAVAPYSGLAAVFLGGKPVIRVYAQMSNNSIQEYCYDDNSDGWTMGSNLGPALPGTSIAATSWDSGSLGIRVFFQDTGPSIVEKCWDGGGPWEAGGLHLTTPILRCSLGATSWPRGNSVSVRVYYGAAGNRIFEKAWDGKWHDGDFNQPCLAGSRLAAIPHPFLRVYLQETSSTAVTEFAWSKSGGWSISCNALPPA